MESQLAEFLHHKKVNSQGPAVDWETKKLSWISSVGNLFEDIKRMLHDSITSQDVLIDETDMAITE